MKKPLLFIVFTVIILIFYKIRTADPGPDSVPPAVATSSPRLASLLGADDDADYAQAVAARDFVFPQDHGPHRAYRNEWWYLTGNLDGENRERFGFEMTFFRFSLTPGEHSEASAWRSNQVFMGHFAITDRVDNQFRVASRFSRGSAGLAGAESTPSHIWLENWDLRETDDGTWHLLARDHEIAIDLALVPVKPPVLNGIAGLSIKSSTPGNASYYYSIPRLQTTGTLQTGGKSYQVSGLSWLDREWGSSGLSADQSGWDWFALQLNDGSDLMFYNLRQIDGSQDRHSAGTYSMTDGTAMPLSREDVSIAVLEYWSNADGARYPMAWHIEIGSQSLSLDIRPILADQELKTLVRYWEGAVDVTGTRAGREVNGRGYVELTGYADSE
jgi:predicted secreted hydrolase